ncbi:MAG: SPOR domain-containing protein [Desulfobacteraceae bacterium]|nr:SPOR domain-containing protein [Desulfobacteraceae bacterium]
MSKKKQAAFIVSGKAMTIGICVVLCALVWMFALGIWVGRGTTPLGFKIYSLKEDLESLLQTSENKENTFETESDIGSKKTDLEFYETLKRPQSGTEIRRIPITPEPASKAPVVPEVKKRRVPDKNVPDKTTDQVKSTVPTPTVPSTADKPYTIQVASIKKMAAADKLVEEFKAKGLPAYHVKANIPGKGTWYRIRVGAYQNKGAAAATVKQLKGMNYTPMVVKR